jgi:branched-chain amino acid transport system ATP-binding protein
MTPAAPAAQETPPAQRALLAEASGVAVRFDGVHALEGVDLSVGDEVLGLIGPNGAGKTTLVNVLTGFQRPNAGSVSFRGEDITSRSPHSLARMGIGRTFQKARSFGSLTVRENVEVAALGVGASRQDAARRAAAALLATGLADRADRLPEELSPGHERHLGLARAWALAPRLVYLDEPAAGLGGEGTEHLAATIGRLRDEFGCSIVVIDHDIDFVMGLCDRMYVLDGGRVLAAGTPAEVAGDDRVLDAYLGPG